MKKADKYITIILIYCDIISKKSTSNGWSQKVSVVNLYSAAPGSVPWIETSTAQQSQPLLHNYEELNVSTEKEKDAFPQDNKYDYITITNMKQFICARALSLKLM